MAKKSYNVKTTTRPAQPRNKRMREAGYSSSAIIVGGGVSTSGGETHTHANKDLLDALSANDENYLLLTRNEEIPNATPGPDDSTSTEQQPQSTTHRIKAGYADDAAHAVMADAATHAITSDESLHAAQADEALHAADADRWGGNRFEDYMDQPVRKTDRVWFGQVKTPELMTPEFASGLSGFGGRMDEGGNIEVQSLFSRGFIETPELRYNRVDVTSGDVWYSPCAGIISDVDTVNQIITLKLEQGEIGTPHQGDICMGIFHSSTPADNVASDYDDSRGNRRFAGFATCYFRVSEMLDASTHGRFKYQLRPVSDSYAKQLHPSVSMTFVGYGSFTDATRQTSRYETRTYQRYLKNVSDWEFTSGNIAAQFGDLANLSVHGLDMSGYSAYLNNIYMSGVIRQFTPGGDQIPTINDRGVWSASEVYNRHDDVYYDNAKWRCLVDGTTSTPKKDAAEWVLLQESLPGKPGVDGSSAIPVYRYYDSEPKAPTGSVVPPAGWQLDMPAMPKPITTSVLGTKTTLYNKIPYYILRGAGGEKTITARINITTTTANQKVYIELVSFSEPNFDFIGIGKINTSGINPKNAAECIARISGNGVVTVVVLNIPMAGSNFVEVAYGKDTSGDLFGDYGLFRIISGGVIWMSMGAVKNNIALAWSAPVNISPADGKPGIDGEGVEFIFTRTATENSDELPAVPNSATTPYQKPPAPWTNNPTGVDAINRYEWGSVRAKAGGVWSAFSPIAIWSRYALDGQDGEGLENIFTRTATEDFATVPAVPDSANTPFNNPSVPWTADPQGVDASHRCEWITQRVKVDGTWGAFSAPAVFTRYALDGEGLENIFTRTTTEDFATVPAVPDSANTPFNNPPVPWTADPQGVDASHRCEWISKRIKSEGAWDEFSTPVPFARYVEDGDPGIQGCIIRITEWVSGVEYRNDSESKIPGLRYVDIVTRNIDNTQYRFECVATHTSSISNAPDSTTSTTLFWHQLNDMAPIYTPLLLADNAQINFLQGMSVCVLDSDKNIVAGLVGGPTPLFVGSASADSAPFRVAMDGSFVATKANITGTINATGGKIGNFSIDNDYWLTSKTDNCEMFMSSVKLSYDSDSASLKTKHSIILQGLDSISGSAVDIAAAITVQNTNTSMGHIRNVGLAISTSGSYYDTGSPTCGNFALYIEKGKIGGIRVQVRNVYNNITLNNMDYWVLVRNSGGITITLPPTPEDGQVIWIKRHASNSNNFTIKVADNSGQTLNDGFNYTNKTSWSHQGQPTMFIYDAISKCWDGGYMNLN